MSAATAGGVAPRSWALPIVVATVLVDTVGFGIVIPVFPSLITGLTGQSLTQAAATAGWLTMGYAVMQFLFGPVMGNLSDRFGRRPLMLTCLALFAIDYFAAAFAPTIWWLLAARLLAGVTGASFTVAYAYIADITPPEKRAANFGLIGVAFGLGFIIGPALGGIVAGLGHHAPFILAGSLAALNCVVGFFLLPESLAPENRRPFDWRRANPAGAVAQVARLGGPVRLMAIGLFAWFIAHQSLQGLWNFYSTYRFGWGPTEVGLSLAAVGVGSVIMQGLVIKRAVARFGERGVAPFAMAMGTIAFLLYGLAYQPWVGLVGIVFGAFSSMAYPSIQALMTAKVAADSQGELQGALACLNSLAVIIGPPLMTNLFAYFTSPAAPFQAPGLPFLVASALALFTMLAVRRALRE